MGQTGQTSLTIEQSEAERQAIHWGAKYGAFVGGSSLTPSANGPARPQAMKQAGPVPVVPSTRPAVPTVPMAPSRPAAAVQAVRWESLLNREIELWGGDFDAGIRSAKQKYPDAWAEYFEAYRSSNHQGRTIRV